MMHAFIREVHLTEQEYYEACGIIAELGRRTTASHNEVVLTAGALGLSTLVESTTLVVGHPFGLKQKKVFFPR